MKLWQILIIGLCLSVPVVQADELSESERERIEQELDAAQQELQQATERVAELSTKLGGVAFSYVFNSDINRGVLGIVLDNAGDELRVASVTPDSAAEKTGVKAGDVIVAVNGEAIDTEQPGLPSAFENIKPGEEVELTLRRRDDTHEVKLVAQARSVLDWALATADLETLLPEIEIAVAGQLQGLDKLGDLKALEKLGEQMATWSWPVIDRRWRNLELVKLTPELGSYFDADAGILVVNAPSENPLGLKAGDVILKIGERPPNNASHAFRILRSYGAGETVSVEILRHGEEQTLEHTVEADGDVA